MLHRIGYFTTVVFLFIFWSQLFFAHNTNSIFFPLFFIKIWNAWTTVVIYNFIYFYYLKQLVISKRGELALFHVIYKWNASFPEWLMVHISYHQKVHNLFFSKLFFNERVPMRNLFGFIDCIFGSKQNWSQIITLFSSWRGWYPVTLLSQNYWRNFSCVNFFNDLLETISAEKKDIFE